MTAVRDGKHFRTICCSTRAAHDFEAEHDDAIFHHFAVRNTAR